MIKSTHTLVAAGCLTATLLHTAAQSPWSGLGPTPNWNDAANWEGGFPPGPTFGALFKDFGDNPGQLTNVVSASLTIPELTCTATSNRFVTLLPAGSVLTLQPAFGFGQPLLRVGTDAAGGGDDQVYATLAGAGTLAPSQFDCGVSVRQISESYGNHQATLDLSALATFTASVSNLWVGADAVSDGAFGALRLARTNAITTAPSLTAPGILLGRGAFQSAAGTLELGQANVIHTDGLVVGGAHSGGYPASRLSFGAGLTHPSFQLRGSAGGTSRAELFAVGDATATETGYTGGPEGSAPGYGTTADLSGGAVDLLVNSLVVGRSALDPGVGYGWAYGTLLLDGGVVDAHSVAIAQQSGTNFTSASGEVVLRGTAVLNVSGDLALAQRPGPESFAPVGSLAVSNAARVNVRGNFLDGNGSSTLMLGGGIVDLQPPGDPTPGDLAVDQLSGWGTITNAAAISVKRGLTIGTDLMPAALGLDGNLALGSYLEIKFNLDTDPTPGLRNDFVRVGGDLSFDEDTIVPVYNGPLTPGTYHLFDYAGTLSGNVSFLNQTRLNLTLDTTTPHHLDLLVSGAPGILTWSGLAGNQWDTFTPLWNHDTDKFYTLDNVTFDDSGTATTVAIGDVVEPGSVTVTGSQNYRFEGWGKITGFTGLELHGPGLLSLALSSDFRGPVHINGGTLITERWQALGATNGGTFVANGGTLDIHGQFMNDPEPVFIAGSGQGGNGAINNSGSPSLFGLRQLALTADASVHAPAGGNWGVSDSSPLGTVVDLAGHTLTKLGGGILDFYGCRVTNSGSINVAAGALRVRDSVVSGPGTLSLGANELMFQNNYPTGYIAKPITVNGGSLATAGEAASITAPLTLAGPLVVKLEAPLRLSGAVVGPGSLTKQGFADLLLEAANGYLGATRITSGQLVLGAAAGIAGTSRIEVEAGAVFDVTAQAGGYALSSGQALALDGTLAGDLIATAANPIAATGSFNGSLQTGGGTTLVVGGDGAMRTVGVANDLTLSGAEFTFELTADSQAGNGVNDLVTVGGNLTFTGMNTLVLRPIGILGGTYTLFTYAGSLTGGVPNITLATPSRYTFTLVDPATTPGEIRVQVSGSAASLVWQGGAAGAPTLWDLKTTSNWLDAGLPAVFYEGDLAAFTDAALTNRVDFAGTLRPAAITLNNHARPYRFAGSGSLFAGSLTNQGSAGLVFANAADNTFTGEGLVLLAGTVTFAQPMDATLRSRLGGTATLAKAGADTLTIISPASTNFSGTTAIQAGTLRLGSENALGPSTVNLSAGARLDLNGQVAEACTVHVLGAGPDGSGAINNLGPEQTLALTKVELDADSALGAAAERWDVAPGGVFRGNSNALVKLGAGQLWIRSGSDTGLGDVDVQAGTLVFAGAGTTLGDPGKPILVQANASLGFGGDILAGTKPATLLPGASVYAANTGNSYAGAVMLSNGLVRLESNSELELAGPLQGPAQLKLTSASFSGGRLVVSGTNTYAGGTEVNVGILSVAAAAALPASSIVVLTNTGLPYSGDLPVLELRTNVVTATNTALRMHSDGFNGLDSMVAGGSATWGGPVTLAGDGRFIFDGQPGGLTFAGPFAADGVSGTVICQGYDTVITLEQALRFDGALEMGSLGLGVFFDVFTTLTLNSPDNSWQSTRFVRGRINLGADNALPLAPIYVGTFAGNDHRVILDLAGHNQTLVEMVETMLGNDPITIGNSSTGADSTLTYAGTGGMTITTAAIVDALDSGFHTTRLTVSAGTLQLLGTNTYTGATLVSGGTLLVSRFTDPFGGPSFIGQLGFTPVTVSSDGTLGGDGSILGPVAIGVGGTLAPGNSIGTLTMHDTLTLGPGGQCVLEVDLGAGTNDMVIGPTALQYGGRLVIQNIGVAEYTTNTVLKLFDAASYTAGPVTIEPTAPGLGLQWDTSMLATDGTLRVAAAPVPPTIAGFARLPDGNFSLTLTGTVGQPYAVLGSTNIALPLAQWTVLESGLLPSSPYTYPDLAATNQPVRFYQTSTP
jgi:autotransporter-associated beta strand protein